MPVFYKVNRFFFLLFVFCIFLTVYTDGRRFNKNLRKNFISVKFTNESVRELRIAFRGILVMESSAFQNSEFELKLKQITDGRRFVQTVHQNGILKDCDKEGSSELILNFVEKFASIFKGTSTSVGDVFEIYEKQQGNSSDNAIMFFKNRRSLGKFRQMVKMKQTMRACHRFTKEIRKENLHQRSTEIKNETDFFEKLIKKLKRKIKTEFQSENDKSSVALATKLDNNKSHKKLQSLSSSESRSKQKMAKSTIEIDLNGESKTVEDVVVNKRSKRSSLFNRFLMYPGTKWCGRGQTAVHFNDLGTDREADVCCRDHDLCPHIIESFSYKFGMFNYRIHALLHCKCDRRFRDCLKQSISPTASFIGEIYFNIMGTKCFEFEYQKVCTARSWWGTCLKKEIQKIARVIDQEEFGYY